MDITIPVPQISWPVAALLVYVVGSYIAVFIYHKLPDAVQTLLDAAFHSFTGKEPVASGLCDLRTKDRIARVGGAIIRRKAQQRTELILAPLVTALFLKSVIGTLADGSKRLISSGFWLVAGYIGVKTLIHGTQYLSNIIESFSRN